MSARRGIDLVVAVLVTAAVLYAVTDDPVLDRVLYLGVLDVAAAVAWVGAARAPVGQRLVGMLIAGGLTLTALGDTLWDVLDVLGQETDVSIADAPWIASYVLLCVALSVVLRRSGAGRHDLDFTIDAITIVVVSVLVLWSTSIDTIVKDASMPVFVRLVWAAYPVADAVLLALVVRVLTSRVARRFLDPSFAVGVGLWLVADIAYLHPAGSTVEVLMDVCWMLGPVFLARSVWRLGPIAAPSPQPPGRARPVFPLAIAIAPLMVPPVLEMTADLLGYPDRPLALIVGAAALTVLAFLRMARLVRSEERAARELETARDAALEASRAKSMFLATMSHEIRTPLTMVLGAGEILEDTELNDLQRDLVTRMRRSGQALRSLVDDVLDFSRIEAGHIEVAQVPFDLGALVEDLAERCRPRAEAVGVAYESRLAPELPRTVIGDPDRLRQVLGNLLDNAVKFTHEGGVRLHVRRVAPGDRVVEFAVADTGIGIAADDLATVFESFRQVDGSSTRRYGGAGLGLAISRELTALMGGTLDVTSTVGVGSVFAVRVPLVATREAAHDDLAARRRDLRREDAGRSVSTSR